MGNLERAAREKAAHREKREKLILEKAEALFLEKGFTSATISEIASACELTNGAIYLYYKNKDQLILKVMAGISRSFADLLEKAAAEGLGRCGIERLQILLDMYNMTYRDYRNYHFLDAQFNLMFCKSYPEGPFLDEFFNANRRVLLIITDAVAAGLKDGSLSSHLPAERTAGMLLNAVNSYVEKISLRGELMEMEQGIKLEEELRNYIIFIINSLRPVSV